MSVYGTAQEDGEGTASARGGFSHLRSILSDKEAGVAREHDVWDLTLRALGEPYHFVDVNKMMLDRVA